MVRRFTLKTDVETYRQHDPEAAWCRYPCWMLFHSAYEVGTQVGIVRCAEAWQSFAEGPLGEGMKAGGIASRPHTLRSFPVLSVRMLGEGRPGPRSTVETMTPGCSPECRRFAGCASCRCTGRCVSASPTQARISWFCMSSWRRSLGETSGRRDPNQIRGPLVRPAQRRWATLFARKSPDSRGVPSPPSGVRGTGAHAESVDCGRTPFST